MPTNVNLYLTLLYFKFSQLPIIFFYINAESDFQVAILNPDVLGK